MPRTMAALAALLVIPQFLAAAEPNESKADEAVSGREIFVREWVANDPRSHGGDGLGPVFNGSSCVTCHNQGGAGGAGGFDENVTLLSATFPIFGPAPQAEPAPGTDATGIEENRLRQIEFEQKKSRDQLAEMLHPDFARGDTVVLHRFGNSEEHANWRTRVMSGETLQQLQMGVPAATFISPSSPQVVTGTPTFPQPQAVPFVNVNTLQIQAGPGGLVAGSSFPILGRITNDLNTLKAGARNSTSGSFGFRNITMQSSQRNTTALWGAGLVDRIPVSVIEEIAARQQEAGGRISGRVHHLPDGRIGRFGWKAQKATLYDFTMAACAVELGLNVPGEKQSPVPYDREYDAVGLDLTKREVDALVDYIAEFPQPGELKPEHAGVVKHLADGEQLFTEVGCAQCHQRDVGEVTGIFTDFLLHDLGPDLGSVGSYGVPSVPEPDPDIPVANAEDGRPKAIPPTSREWRTPALWGVRDSAPYLHDGRARTLEQAIAFHGGEAAETRLRYMMLEADERAKVVAFLKSLVAPDSVASAE